MRDINEISFEEFAEAIANLDVLAIENRRFYAQMLFRICKKCRLAAEMFLFIAKTRNGKTEKMSKITAEQHKVVIAMWLVLNRYNCSDDNELEEVPKHVETKG